MIYHSSFIIYHLSNHLPVVLNLENANVAKRDRMLIKTDLTD